MIEESNHSTPDPAGSVEEPARKVPIVASYDVVVVGGSQSGVAAAVSAARLGARVLVVERNCFLGGQSVATMVVQWEKRAFINNLGAVCTRGIAKEMLDQILALGGSDQLWNDPPGCEEMRDGEEWLEIEAIKITLLKMCIDAGVDILFDTWCVGAVVSSEPGCSTVSIDGKIPGKGDGSDARGSTAGARGFPRVEGIIVENKSGRQAIKARIVIDATAYLDVIWHALGEEGVIINDVEKRMGPGWYTVFGGVDSARFVEYILNNKICSGYPSLANPDKVRHHLATGRLLLYRGFANILDQAYEKGMMDDWPAHLSPPFNLNVKWWGGDRWCSSLDPFKTLDALDAWALSRAEIDRQIVSWKILEFLRLIPGWENAYISRSSVRLGLRETRILKAVTMLTRDDIFNPNHERPDAIGRSGAHDPGKNRLRKAYPIPYGIIVPEKLDGVLVCSRTIGAADRTALDAHRGIVPTIVVGQAAGTAAALAVKNGIQPRDVDIGTLREILRENDVVLDVETVDLPTIPERFKNA